ncbi:MAG: hypothetical protein WC326_12835 [Candidatus Delongbacteria bacterium]
MTGLLSSFISFQSVVVAFVFGLVLFILGKVFEFFAFAHPAAFLHALPTFDIDPAKWTGMVFGYACPPDKSIPDVPLVGMAISDHSYARQLSELLLVWSDQEKDDKDGCIVVRVIILNESEYMIICRPGINRKRAKDFFDLQRQNLSKVSLMDIVVEHHGMIVFGKRCVITASSFFPKFREKYKDGTPVIFGFFDADRPELGFIDALPQFRLSSFSIVRKNELTRHDPEYDLLPLWETGGVWQGPGEPPTRKSSA